MTAARSPAADRAVTRRLSEARHPSTGPAALARLAEDPDASVRETARKRLNREGATRALRPTAPPES